MLSGCEFLGSLLAIIIKAAGITSASANARVPPPRRSAEVFLPERLNVSECVEGCACGLRVRVAGGLDLCCTRFALCESGLAGSFHASNWYYWVGVCDVCCVRGRRIVNVTNALAIACDCLGVWDDANWLKPGLRTREPRTWTARKRVPLRHERTAAGKC